MQQIHTAVREVTRLLIRVTEPSMANKLSPSSMLNLLLEEPTQLQSLQLLSERLRKDPLQQQPLLLPEDLV